MAVPNSLVPAMLVAVLLLISGVICAMGQRAPARTSDGTSLDMLVAYLLMFAALLLTYVMHPIDAFPFNLF